MQHKLDAHGPAALATPAYGDVASAMMPIEEFPDVLLTILLINRFTPNGVATDLKGPTFNSFDSSLWNIQDWHK